MGSEGTQEILKEGESSGWAENGAAKMLRGGFIANKELRESSKWGSGGD